MFPYMGNIARWETELVDGSIEELRRRLPDGWSVRRARSRPPRGLWEPDYLYDVRSPNGSSATLAVEVKRSLPPRDVVTQRALWRSVDPQVPVMVVTDYISPRAREVLEEADLNYADATGTLRLRLPDPLVVIDVRGDGSAPRSKPERRELQSLRTAAAGRGVRALADFRPPHGVRDFAARADLAPATVSRLFDFLDREALIERDSPRTPVRKVDWAALLRRWAQDYTFETSNRIITLIEPRTLPRLFEKLETYDERYAVTGSYAATRWAPVAPPRLVTMFADDVDRVARDLDLKPVEVGINVVMAEPFDPVVFDRTQRIEEVTYAAPSQVVADLLNGPGRAPQEAEALLRWMARNERAWRS